MGVDSSRLLIIAFAHGYSFDLFLIFILLNKSPSYYQQHHINYCCRFAILLLVFATGHVSGGHINPVVSLAMIVTGNINWVKGNVV